MLLLPVSRERPSEFCQRKDNCCRGRPVWTETETKCGTPLDFTCVAREASSDNCLLACRCVPVCAAQSSHKTYDKLHSHLDAHDATLLRRTNMSLSLASDGPLFDLSPQTALRHTSLDELA